MNFVEFKRRRKEKKENKINNFSAFVSRQLITTSKALIWIFAINAIIWIYFSYILAFLGKENIAEALSSNVCQVIIGQIAFYLITKTVENVFKYNNFGGITNPYLLRKEVENNGNNGEQSDPVNINNDSNSDSPINGPAEPSIPEPPAGPESGECSSVNQSVIVTTPNSGTTSGISNSTLITSINNSI